MSPKPKCPLCRQPSTVEHSPFCSATCQDRDLLNWLDERYVSPGPPADPDMLDKD